MSDKEYGNYKDWDVVVMEEIVGKDKFDLTIEGQRAGYEKEHCEENVTWRIVGESPKRMLEYKLIRVTRTIKIIR